LASLGRRNDGLRRLALAVLSEREQIRQVYREECRRRGKRQETRRALAVVR